MAKDLKNKIGVTQTKGRKSANMTTTAIPTPSLPALQRLQDSGKKANLNSGGTRRNYEGYMKRGRDWLAGHFSENSPSGLPQGVDKADLPSLQDDIYEDPEFKNAFNERPNKYSHQALALFISYKCFHQNLKKGTGTSIHAAFKKYWEQL